MVEQKAQVLTLVCLTSMLMISGCATTHFNGAKNVGDYKDGKWHGQGTNTYADGRVKEGIWKNDVFQYARKG